MGVPFGGYSDHLSVEALVRLHNEATLRYLGDERIDKLERVQSAVKDTMARYKKDFTLDQDQMERLVLLDGYIARDLAYAKQCNIGAMPEEDRSPNEP